MGLDDTNLLLRNQLFVAISRSRAWVSLSGVRMSDSGLAREITTVLDSGTSLSFIYKGKPKRFLELEIENF